MIMSEFNSAFDNLEVAVGNRLELLRNVKKTPQNICNTISVRRDYYRTGEIFWVPNHAWPSGMFYRAKDSDCHPGLVVSDGISSDSGDMVPGSTHAYNTEVKKPFKPTRPVKNLKGETCFLLIYREDISSSEVGGHLATLHQQDIDRLRGIVRCDHVTL